MDEPATAADIENDDRFGEPQTPRLSILHLMLWTLCSALHLTVYRALISLQRGELPPGYAESQDVRSAIMGIVAGAMFAGALVLVGTRLRSGPPMLRQPGHWLLFVAGLNAVVHLPIMTVMMLMQHSQNFMRAAMLIHAVSLVVSPVAYTVAATRQQARRWQIIFLLLAAFGAVVCLAYTFLGLDSLTQSFGITWWILGLLNAQMWINLLLGVGVFVTSVGERASGKRYDWLHWLGITTFLLTRLLGLAFVLSTLFFS